MGSDRVTRGVGADQKANQNQNETKWKPNEKQTKPNGFSMKLVPYAVPYRKFDESELKRRICTIGEGIKGARIRGRMAAKPYG